MKRSEYFEWLPIAIGNCGESGEHCKDAKEQHAATEWGMCTNLELCAFQIPSPAMACQTELTKVLPWG